MKDSFILVENGVKLTGGNIIRDTLNVKIMKPFIMLFKNNVRRPIYYKNSINELQQKLYRNWLMDTYLTNINEQFRYRTFLIKAEYIQLNTDNITFELFEGSKNYNWKGYDIGSIVFNKNIYKEYNYNKGIGKIKDDDMGFIISIKNAILPKDSNNNDVGYVDKNNRSLSKYILPYLEVYHVNYGSVKDVLPSVNTLNYDSLNSRLKSFNTKKYYNFTERDYVDEYTIYAYDPEPKVKELVKIDTNTFNDQINKMNNNDLLPTNITVDDPKSNMYVTNLFVNTKTIKDYTIKMKLIADTILTRYHSDKIESIDNYSYNLSELEIINLYVKNKSFYYGNDKILRLDNKIVKPHNLKKLFIDIKDLRKDFCNVVIRTNE